MTTEQRRIQLPCFSEDCAIGQHPYSPVECRKCGETSCWECSGGPHDDSGSWEGQTCAHCGASLAFVGGFA